MVSYMGLLPAHYASHYDQSRKDQNIATETFLGAPTYLDSIQDNHHRAGHRMDGRINGSRSGIDGGDVSDHVVVVCPCLDLGRIYGIFRAMPTLFWRAFDHIALW